MSIPFQPCPAAFVRVYEVRWFYLFINYERNRPYHLNKSALQQMSLKYWLKDLPPTEASTAYLSCMACIWVSKGLIEWVNFLFKDLGILWNHIRYRISLERGKGMFNLLWGDFILDLIYICKEIHFSGELGENSDVERNSNHDELDLKGNSQMILNSYPTRNSHIKIHALFELLLMVVVINIAKMKF